MNFIILTTTEEGDKFLHRNTDHLNKNCSVTEKVKKTTQ